jgi:hypothetical protein
MEALECHGEPQRVKYLGILERVRVASFLNHLQNSRGFFD